MPAAWQGTNRQGLLCQSEPALHYYAEFHAAFCLTPRSFWIRDRADAAGSRATEPAGECPSPSLKPLTPSQSSRSHRCGTGGGMFLVTPGKPGCEASQVQRLLLSAHTTNSSYRAAAGRREHNGSRLWNRSEIHSRKFMFFFLVLTATH